VEKERGFRLLPLPLSSTCRTAVDRKSVDLPPVVTIAAQLLLGIMFGFTMRQRPPDSAV